MLVRFHCNLKLYASPEIKSVRQHTIPLPLMEEESSTPRLVLFKSKNSKKKTQRHAFLPPYKFQTETANTNLSRRKNERGKTIKGKYGQSQWRKSNYSTIKVSRSSTELAVSLIQISKPIKQILTSRISIIKNTQKSAEKMNGTYVLLV